MTDTQQGQDPPTPDKTQREQEVAAFLKAAPSFLLQHPDVLTCLEVPHSSGGAVSLIEHQVRALRRENNAMKQRIQTFCDTARDNERLATLTSNLMVALCRVDGISGWFDTWVEHALQQFKVPWLALWHSGQNGLDVTPPCHQKTLGLHRLTPAVQGAMKACSSLQRQQVFSSAQEAEWRQSLFPHHPHPEQLASMAIMTLQWREQPLYWVLAAHEAERYPDNAGMHFLAALQACMQAVLTRLQH